MALLSPSPSAQEAWSQMLLAWCPVLISNLAASELLVPALPLLLLPKVGASGSAKALRSMGVTSSSWSHPIPGPAYPSPLAAPENMTILGGGGVCPLGQTPEGPRPQAQCTQTALSPSSWRLFCLAGAVLVPETKPDRSKCILRIFQLGGPG